MSFGGLANCPLCWDAPEICKCKPADVDAYYKTMDIINQHKARVFRYMTKIAHDLMQRGNDHDQSKFGPAEFPTYSSTIDKFEEHQFGTPGYFEAKEAIKEATDHHFKHNRHHPEHFKDGIEGMNLVDLIEMICDWKSATLNHPKKPGNMHRSLHLATEKYKISPQLARVLYNTMRDYELI